MNNIQETIISRLPYRRPFLFVDSISDVSEEGITGSYQLREDEYFYTGHFPSNPVTPGVIIIEIMAQIGLVSLGIFLNLQRDHLLSEVVPVFSSSNVDFLSPAYPNDHLCVKSKKIYYRLNKLKCEIECLNLSTGKAVCRGVLSGLIVNKRKIGRN